MKRVLLPTDFSDNAYNAIKYAVQLLKEETCQFYLLHTYTPAMISAGSMMDSYSALTLQKVAQDRAKKQLDELAARIIKEFPNSNHSFTCNVSFNMLISEMTNSIEANAIDFVIMGTKGATGAKEVFLGTRTMYAIKNLECPVLAVPGHFDYEAPKEILFPTDFKLNKDNKFLPMLRELCDQHVARLHILNAYYGIPLTEIQIDNKSFLDAYFIDNAHLFHISEGTDVVEAVAQFQIKTKINLMVMIHNKHNFLENILFKPVINHLVYHTNVPFLVIPSVERQLK
ncbi:nucleotide-binding universal stress UspA family protein [Ulvibacter sp. MAR_2010_11]|uniref:universal stress protein n=1 Tax=Ulvibacter sp. MAR_2010_11 TaxID=1250229 RepID=UPI000C2B9A9C|nr:universal stress protein [Ulvibacter sp. MAR_2010_11]PKA84491.1 nucleotide-binding universal stress UspA family protein [Ulvibacter sp. MAR_2010_11]